MNLKYWDVEGNTAILKRKVIHYNNKKLTHKFVNITMQGIRFLICQDEFISDAEKQELLYII